MGLGKKKSGKVFCKVILGSRTALVDRDETGRNLVGAGVELPDVEGTGGKREGTFGVVSRGLLFAVQMFSGV